MCNILPLCVHTIAIIEQSDDRLRILHNFTERLEAAIGDVDSFADLPDTLLVDREDPVRIQILDLLINNLEIKGKDRFATTFAHFLLGYDTKESLEKTVLQGLRSFSSFLLLFCPLQRVLPLSSLS